MDTRSCAVCAGPIREGARRRITCGLPCQRIHRRRTGTRYRARVRALQPDPVAARRCPGCRQDLPASAFQSHRGRVSGLQTFCRACRRAAEQQPEAQLKSRRRKRIWYLRHWSAVQARRCRRWLFDREFRDRQLAERRARYALDPQAIQFQRKQQAAARGHLAATASRRCWCGKGLPATDPDRWFCGPRCLVRCSHFVCGLEFPHG